MEESTAAIAGIERLQRIEQVLCVFHNRHPVQLHNAGCRNKKWMQEDFSSSTVLRQPVSETEPPPAAGQEPGRKQDETGVLQQLSADEDLAGAAAAIEFDRAEGYPQLE